MKMMHYFRDVKKIEVPFTANSSENFKRDLIKFLFGIYKWAHCKPVISLNEKEEGRVLYLLFPSIAFGPDDFWSYFGEEIMGLNEAYKLEFYSTGLESADVVYMEIKKEDEKYFRVYKTVSGAYPDYLESLALGIDLKAEEGEALKALLSSIDWDEDNFILKKEDSRILDLYQVENIKEKTYYAYGWMGKDPDPSSFLSSLNFEEKVALWEEALKTGEDFLEFDWLYEDMLSNDLYNRVEWDFALYKSLRDLKYSLVISENKFELKDYEKNPVYFNFNENNSFYKCFLKILFPIKIDH